MLFLRLTNGIYNKINYIWPSMTEKLKKFDRIVYGIIVTIILLFVGFLLSFLVKGGYHSLHAYIYGYAFTDQNRLDVFIFCLIPNILLFYFTNFRWNLTEFNKGLVGVTIVLVLALAVFELM